MYTRVFAAVRHVMCGIKTVGSIMDTPLE